MSIVFCERKRTYKLIDYIIAKVISSRISARPTCRCNLERIMSLDHPETLDSRDDTDPEGLQLRRAGVLDDTHLAMILSFLSHANIFSCSSPKLEKYDNFEK